MTDGVRSYEYNEYVSGKLGEWADPQVRCEKRKIQKHIVSEYCRDWLKDVVYLDPLEIELLSNNYAESTQLKKDHIKYVRKAIFAEYTFKRKLTTKSKNNERQGNSSSPVRKTTSNSFEGSEPHGPNKSKIAATRRLAELLQLRDENMFANDKPASVNAQWFSEVWTNHLQSQADNVFASTDRDRSILEKVSLIAQFVLGKFMEDNVKTITSMIKSGILQTAIKKRVQQIVDKLIKRTRNRVDAIDYAFLDDLSESALSSISNELLVQVLQLAPKDYFENKVSNLLITTTISPIVQSVYDKIMAEDQTIGTTEFHNDVIVLFLKEKASENLHLCLKLEIAEEIANEIAANIVQNVDLTLGVFKKPEEESTPKTQLKSKHEMHIDELKKQAVEQAKKNLQHLKNPETARRDMLKKRVDEKYAGKNDNCKCSKISPCGGKKKPFTIPHYKRKSVFYFHKEHISDANKRLKTLTLFPKTRPGIKLVCDNNWNCKAAQIKRDLRDIPYRFSYAPPSVVKQIKNTKSIKKEDAVVIKKIVQCINARSEVQDMSSIVKNIVKKPDGSDPVLFGGESRMRKTIDSIQPPDVSGRKFLPSQSSKESVRSGRGKTSSKDYASQICSSKSYNLGNEQSANSTAGVVKKKASISPKVVVKLKHTVTKARTLPQMYHKHILEGYTYSMVPMTPCRFHSLKVINTILRRFDSEKGQSPNLEKHFEVRSPPINIDELLPIPRLRDTYGHWREYCENVSSLWTRSLNDSRLKRMAMYRKLYKKDPIFGFVTNWENVKNKCQK